MPLLAFDSTNSSFALPQAQSAGATIAIRYFSLKGKSKWKILKRKEAEKLTKAGVSILPVFQFAGNALSEFTRAKGKRDGKNALLSAQKFKMPAGATILFSADWNPSSNQILGNIIPYFEEVRKVLNAHSTKYQIGVYGSGLTCKELENAGLVYITWLAQATKWRGFKEYQKSKKWAIFQEMPTSTPSGDEFNFDRTNASLETLGTFFYHATGSVLRTNNQGVSATTTNAVSPLTSPQNTPDNQWPGILFAEGGSHDDSLVEDIQNRLNHHSYGLVAVDGDYGRATANQVRAFQAKNDDSNGIALDIDGEVGKSTWWALFHDSEIMPSITVPDPNLDVRENFIRIAKSQIGVKETNRNRGPSIDAYILSTGLKPWNDEYAWCVCFIYWCAYQLAAHGGGENTLKKTAGVHSLWRLAKLHASTVVTSATASSSTVYSGMLFFLDRGQGLGHAGIVTGVEGDYITTIEGNTDGSGTREGDGVYARKRKIKSGALLGYADYWE